jgi:hypothetical protein
VKTAGEDWQWVVLDLANLELAVEGDGAYEASGSPTRAEQLTFLKFAVHAKHEKAMFLLDDISFYRELPAALKNE